MYARRKEKTFEIIKKEKSLLSPAQIKTLKQLREHILNDFRNVQPMTDAEYAILTEKERTLDDSAARINYILSKEIEYLLFNRKILDVFITWLKKNKVWLITSQVFGGLGAALTYYLEHKAEIDEIIKELLSGQLFRGDGKPEANCAVELEKIKPVDLFKQEHISSDISQYIMDISINGLEKTTIEEIKSLLDLEEKRSKIVVN